MRYKKVPGDYEVELPGQWPPCPECGSEGRVAIAHFGHRNIRFLCDDLHQLQWEEDNGATGLWIKHYHFWPGGQFEGALPDSYVGVPKAKDLDRRYDINERRLDWIHNEQKTCAECGQPPMRNPYDGRALLTWLRDFHPGVFNQVVAAINAMQPKPNFDTWLNEIIKRNNDVAHEVTRLVRDSQLQGDHSIPKPVLRALWTSWTRPMRMAATDTLAFGVCRPHNNGKSKRLPSQDQLIRRHIDINYNGDLQAAKADKDRWEAVGRVIESIEAYRPLYESAAGGSAR